MSAIEFSISSILFFRVSVSFASCLLAVVLTGSYKDMEKALCFELTRANKTSQESALSSIGLGETPSNESMVVGWYESCSQGDATEGFVARNITRPCGKKSVGDIAQSRRLYRPGGRGGGFVMWHTAKRYA